MSVVSTLGVTPIVEPITIAGSLSVTAAPSGGNVTSAARTATVPADSSGSIAVAGTAVGTVGLERSINGGAFSAVAYDGSEAITVTNGQTLTLRMTGATAGESLAIALTDASRTLIQQVSLVAT